MRFDPDKVELPPRYGFMLPYTIQAETQHKIIDLVLRDLKPEDSAILDTKNTTNRTAIRYPMKRRIGAEGYETRKDMRGNPTVAYEWMDTPVRPLVEAELDKISHLYHSIGQVFVVLTFPLNGLVLHIDQWYGNTYDGVIAPTIEDAVKQGVDPDLHSKQNYYSLKIPLTAKKNNGVPVVSDGTAHYRYDVENRFFGINEYEMLHGVYPVSFYRGVIFIEGVLNVQRLSEEIKSPILMQMIDYQGKSQLEVYEQQQGMVFRPFF